MLTTHTTNEAEELSDKIVIMINGQIIRVNEKQKIPTKGYILHLQTADSISNEAWSRISSSCEEYLCGRIEGMGIDRIYSNSNNRCTFSITHDDVDVYMSDIMYACVEFKRSILNEMDVDVRYNIAMRSIEQSYISYTLHQNK